MGAHPMSVLNIIALIRPWLIMIEVCSRCCKQRHNWERVQTTCYIWDKNALTIGMTECQNQMHISDILGIMSYFKFLFLSNKAVLYIVKKRFNKFIIFNKTFIFYKLYFYHLYEDTICMRIQIN